MGLLDLFSRRKSARAADPYALAGQGRWREAFQAAAILDPQAKDVALQKDAVIWRWREAGDDATARRFSPAPAANPFPGLLNQVAEVRPDDLTPQVLAGALEHQGSLIVRGLLDAATVARHRAGVDRAFAAREAARTGAAETAWFAPPPLEDPELRGYRERANDQTVLTVDSPAFFSGWMATLEQTGVVDLVGDYLRERPVLSACKTTLYRTSPQPGTQWHQDGAFLGRDIGVVNLWVALSDCGVDAPGLEVVPWRLNDLAPTNSHGAYFTWSVGEGIVTQLAAGRSIASPAFKAGDAMLFDQMCLHRTGVRPEMTRGRYAVETWMFAGSSYPDGSRLAI